MTGQLDNRAARAVFLDRHALGETPSGAGRGADLMALVERLGFVQLDSINTVARAHDLILQARRTAYRPPHLKHLHEVDGAVFEHWTHDAAVIPTRFYPHWRLRFERDAEALKRRWRNWHGAGYEAELDRVLAHVRDHGPVGSSDLGPETPRKSGGWWDWHPSKTALEYLWRSGRLAVVARAGFQKRYDLAERVIEDGLRADTACPDPQVTIDWLCGAALDRLGFATPGEISAFWDTVSVREARSWCDQAQARGEIAPLTVIGADGARRQVLARPDLVRTAADLPPAPARMRVLSPFDPMLRDRARAERLFGFHYRIEVFVPEAKRKYGYYVFPLLEGDRMVGRVDMKAQRDSGMLAVAALWPERGLAWGKGRQARFEAALDRVRRFAGLEGVQFAEGWLRAPI